ncbi:MULTISPECIES: hypothetical protein [Bacteroidaceae]|uniref:Uncharacterized protein n=2 Tax=Bacteroides TaxID=816 RepID=A0AAP3STD4_BACOV|nr:MULTISPECIES: hypothetical protein [Bacteroides]EXZ31453.1 hypothetical protein M136_4781 [Bacteroides fragilis str. S36L11]EYA86259.1 hypothetical protein M137_1703 [Bacteroides fragilis str. S36L12]EYA91832.1 hypothetical protein M135_1347 [Bacteroides fragilis str. S36L5]MDC2373908.1 hypothetical protein [Bacteroides ovatus]MDC2389360.1 hypothetical protein [Bacteroides ovatus]
MALSEDVSSGMDVPVGTKTTAGMRKKRYPPHESGRYRWQIDYVV